MNVEYKVEYKVETLGELFDPQTEEKLQIKGVVASCYACFIEDVYDVCGDRGIDNDELIKNSIRQYLHWVSHPVIPSTPLTYCFSGSGDSNEVNDLGKRES